MRLDYSATDAGEVIIRQAGGERWAADSDHWISTGDGRLWNPVDEARRCQAGHGSLRLLCRDATTGAREALDPRAR